MKLILILCFVVNTAYAVFPIIDVQNVNGDYLDEKGSAFAEKAYYALPKVKISHKDISIKFNKREKNLIISDPSTTVELEFDFSFLNVFKAFAFDNSYIKSNTKLFTLGSNVLDMYIDQQKYHMEDVILETDVRNVQVPDDEDLTILDGIVLNAAVKIKKISFSKFRDIVFDDLRIENPSKISEINHFQLKSQKNALPMIIRFLKFNIDKGRFRGIAKIDSYINLWLRMSGTIKTNKENTLIDMHLQRAKLGWFSIRGTILKMARRLKLDGLTVKGSHIIVDLGSSSLKNKIKP